MNRYDTHRHPSKPMLATRARLTTGHAASARFEFPFRSRFAVIDGMRLHYIDEGSGPVVWMMHGMPMWGYVYRKLIPPLVRAGYRCFVPDLMGFGLSDKPEDAAAHRFDRHVSMMTQLIDHVGLRDITVLGQDWGGPIALSYALARPANIRALVLLNTFIERFPENRAERATRDFITGPLPPGFAALFKGGAYSSFLVQRLDVFRKFLWRGWRRGNRSRLGAGFRRPVDPRAMANYLAIHDSWNKRAGIAAFPKMIPNRADHPLAATIDAIRPGLEAWRVPVLVLWPDGDLAWRPEEGERIAGCVPDGEFHLIRNSGHYLQEDAGPEVAVRVIDFLDRCVRANIVPAGFTRA